MRFSLDQVFAPYARALEVGTQRIEVLAANVANADTPGYVARDIDFKSAMQEQSDAGFRMRTTQPGHLVASAAAGPAEVLYRTSVQPTLDGNTVDTERESAAVAETSVRYETTLMLLNSKIRGLKTAITGE